MDTLLNQMGHRLVTRRKQLHLTQDELAEIADMTTQTISTAETGRKALRPENIIKLCDALDISTDYLLRGKISPVDVSLIFQKMQRVPPDKFWLLEQIIVNFIEAFDPEINRAFDQDKKEEA